MAFPRPITWLALDPLNAAQVGRELITQAVDLGADVRIVMPKRKITEQDRQVLIQRAFLILQGQLDRRVKLPKIAQQIVEMVFSGIE